MAMGKAQYVETLMGNLRKARDSQELRFLTRSCSWRLGPAKD